MEIRSRIHHPNDPGMAILYNNVAQLELDAGNFDEADRLMVQALTIWDHEPELYAAERAAGLNNRAFLMLRMGRHAEAGPLAARAIEVVEAGLGEDHPALVSSLVALAAVDRNRGAFENAEAGLQRALAICKARLGPNHGNLAIVLSSFAELRKSEGQHNEAKRFERESRRVASAYQNENKLGYVVDIADIMPLREK
jgi:tetratricopeptide (TPR) repeat protein